MYQVLLSALVLLLAGQVVAQSSVDAIDRELGVVRLAIVDEPPTLNSMKSTDRISAFILLHTNDGLTHYDRHDQLSPAIADRWELNDQGASFWLRRDARWENGAPVTAADFVFAWREVLRPETASRYATLLFPLRNAEEINRGELPLDALGVRAVGDYQLDVDFVKPCAYFPALAAFMTLLPVNETYYREQGDRFAADAGRLLANGPFRLSRWVHGASLLLDANPQWYGRDHLRLRAIEVSYMTNDARARMNLYQDGKIAIAQVAEESLGDALSARQRLRKFADGSLTFLRFNLREGRPTANPNLRYAIQAAIDIERLVDRVVRLPGSLATNSLFPSIVRGLSGRFNDEYPVQAPARGEPLGRKQLAKLSPDERLSLRQPGLALLVSDAPLAIRVAEYLQATLMAKLDTVIRIDRQTFKQRLQKASAGDFDLELSNWSPDFDDPITYADLFASWNPNNRGRYASERYDHWLDVAQSTTAQSVRMSAMDKIQQLIVSDAPIVPLYESAILYVQHPQLRGVVRSRFGADPNLRFAWFAQP